VAELTLTPKENGGRLAARVGDLITIHLPENSAAGYRWTVVSPDQAGVALESQDYQETGTGVGGAGMAVIKLRAKRTGSARLELKKSRSWEPAGGDTFAIDLDIS
jgi:predicted secreted protein